LDHQYLNQLQEGALVQQFFLVRQVESRTDKTGKPYLSLVLGDKSGAMVARVWNDILKRCPGPFTVADFVGVKGQVDSYKQELQLNLKYIETVESIRSRGGDLSAFDPELLVLATSYDRQQLWQELRQMAEEQIQPPLRGLVLRLLERYQEQLLVCPAARMYHHPYLGGLLEHTWFVARHARASLAIYPEINPSLALAGAILHDLGKVKEIAQPSAPELTVSGQLLGHIVLGWEMLREEARAMEFPDANLLLALEHIILAHHGAVEFGSPVPPKTREALLVYFLDDLDAKLKMMSTHLQSDAGDGDFTSYHRVLQRGLYKGGEKRPAGEGKNQNQE
jgi:3'-5' exoribonuclease